MRERRIVIQIGRQEYSWSLAEARSVMIEIRPAITREVALRRRESRVAAGLCRRCYQRPIVPSSTSRCAECREYAAQWARDHA
jgi:hypothetical protein